VLSSAGISALSAENRARPVVDAAIIFLKSKIAKELIL
jgi:hypothetical protein